MTPVDTIKIKADKEITDDDCLDGSGEANKKVYTMTDVILLMLSNLINTYSKELSEIDTNRILLH